MNGRPVSCRLARPTRVLGVRDLHFDGFERSLPQRSDEFLFVGDGMFEAGTTAAYVTDNMCVTATDAAIAQGLRHVDGHLIFVVAASAVVNFDNFHAVGHPK